MIVPLSSKTFKYSCFFWFQFSNKYRRHMDKYFNFVHTPIIYIVVCLSIYRQTCLYNVFFLKNNKRCNVRKRTFSHVRPAKIQISLRIRTVWSETSLSAFWIAKDAKFLHANKEDSNQTARMRRLILVFVERSCQKVGFLILRLKRKLFTWLRWNLIFTKEHQQTKTLIGS